MGWRGDRANGSGSAIATRSFEKGGVVLTTTHWRRSVVHKLPRLLSSPWNYALAALVLCPALVGITCWQQLESTGDVDPSAIEATLTANSQNGPNEEENAAPPQAVDVPRPELELLNEIRGQIGSPLDASLFDKAEDTQSDDSFGATYRREASESGEHNSLLPTRDACQPLHTEPIDPHTRYRTSLRNAARVLDESAADLEELESYELADDLRLRASELRQGARREAALPLTTD